MRNTFGGVPNNDDALGARTIMPLSTEAQARIALWRRPASGRQRPPFGSTAGSGASE